MEVKIGVVHSPRELVVASSQTPDEVEQLVSTALAAEEGTLSLVDEKGRRYVVPSSKIAYVEIAQSDNRKIGFGVSAGSR